MTDKPPEAAPPSPLSLKPLSLQDWESLIDGFQHGGARQHKWTSAHPIRLSLLDQALSSLARRDFPLKLHVITFLEEFCDSLFTTASSGTDVVSLRKVLHRLIETLRALIQTPPDGVYITFALKEQMMFSVTSIVVSLDDDDGVVPIAIVEGLVELLLTVINRSNHGIDRQARALACECLRELEKSRPYLLAVHWLLGFGQLVFKREAKKVKTIVDMGSRFYPSVFDLLALKAMKLDLLAFCSICADVLKSETVLVENDGVKDNLVVKLFKDGLVCVSSFKWLPPGSTETAVAFRTLHRFLIGASSHSDNDPSTTREREREFY